MRYSTLVSAAFALGLMACTASEAQDPEVAETTEAPAAITWDSVAPVMNPYAGEPRILVFSKTREWRHEEGIAGADLHFINLGASKGYYVFTTANSAVFNTEQLAKFDIVVFNNMTGDTLSPEQETVFQNWLEAGGGWIGLHGAGDSSHQDWAWYSETLLGSTFISHPMDPQFQDAELHRLHDSHPVLEGLPEMWVANDEWYTFDAPAQDFGQTVLIGLDESTYSPINKVYGVKDLRMDPDGKGPIAHPIVWTRCVGEGRAFYSAIGHLDVAYAAPENELLLSNALDWVAKKTDAESAGCEG